MTDPKHPNRDDYSRREALRLLGTAAGAGLAAAAGGVPVRAQQTFTSVVPPDFPDGAIIRTLQGDVAPEALADGATLFHEHVGRGDVELAVEESCGPAPSTASAASSTRPPAGGRPSR